MPAAPDYAPSLAASERRRPPQTATQKNSRRVFFSNPSGRTLDRRHLPLRTAPGYRACGYKTASGRPKWLSRDPMGESGSINLYSYVGDDPIDWTDPFGLCPAGIQAAAQYAIGRLGGGGSGGSGIGGGGGGVTGGQGVSPSMVQIGDNNFARIPNPQPLNTSNWHRAPSTHSLNTLESPNLPGPQGYALKLYYDPAEGGNIIAVVHQTNTLAHYGDAVLYEAGFSVNSSIASQYLKDNGQRDPCSN